MRSGGKANGVMASVAAVDSVLVIADIARTVNDFRPLGETLTHICQRVSGLQGYHSTAIFMPRPEQDALTIAGSWGLSETYVRQINHDQPLRLETTSQEGLSPSAEAFRRGRPVAITDVELEPTLAPWRSATRQQGYRSLVCVPVIVRSQVIGVLVGYGRDRHQHSRDELDLLQLISRLAGTAIETARIAEGQRRASEELRNLTIGLQEQNLELSHLSSIQARLTAQLVYPDATAVERTARTLAEITSRAVLVAGRGGNAVAHVGPAETRSPMSQLAARRDVGELLRREQLVAVAGTTCVRLGLPETPMGTLLLHPQLDDAAGTPALAAMHAALVVTAELLSERADRALDAYARPAVLLALANGLYGEPDASEAAGVMGIAADTPLQLALLHCQTPECAQRLARRVDIFRAAGWPVVTATRTGQDAIVLLTAAPAASLRRAAIRLREQHHEIQQIGVSAVVEGMAKLPAALRAAQLAAAVDNGSAMLFEELGPYGSLIGELPPGKARELVDRTLGQLLDHDARRGTSLKETLRVYVEHSGRVQAAATDLGIHPNTMHQRLRRIAQLLNVDIHDYRNLGAVVLALEWDRIMRARRSVVNQPALEALTSPS